MANLSWSNVQDFKEYLSKYGVQSEESNLILSNEDSTIYADAKKGLADSNNLSGWNFKNEYQGEKVNWYFLNSFLIDKQIKLSDLKGMYVVARIYNEKEFFFSVYTKRENDGNDVSWYRSRRTYLTTDAFSGLAGQDVLVYWGEEPHFFPNLKRVKMEIDSFSTVGPQEDDEEILLGGLSTDSSAEAESYDFTAMAIGYKAGIHYVNSTPTVKTDLSPLNQDISVLTNFKNAVELGRFFRGYVADEVEMLALTNPLEFQYVVRIDTETIFKYDGANWIDSEVEASLTGIAGVEEEVVGYSNTHYIDLDGTNDFIELTGVDSDVLDFTKEWSIGFEIENVSSINDSSYTTLLSRGTNEITLRKGGSNWGVYYFANGNAIAQANTWYAPTSGSKVLFVCTGTHLKYYLDGYLRASTSINANVSHNNPSGDLNLGKKVYKSYWYGGVNNLMIRKGSELGSNQLTEYLTGQDVSSMSFYDDIIDFIPLGEGVYPSVNGLKGVVSGELKNGSSSDFVQR